MKDEKAAILIKKMIEAFNQIGLHILAEGIETKEQMEFMKKCGCDLLQGYYFSRPVSFDEALNVIKTTKNYRKIIDHGCLYNDPISFIKSNE